MILACPHTAHGSIAVFRAAAKELGVSRSAPAHDVRADLFARAAQAGHPKSTRPISRLRVLKALTSLVAGLAAAARMASHGD